MDTYSYIVHSRPNAQIALNKLRHSVLRCDQTKTHMNKNVLHRSHAVVFTKKDTVHIFTASEWMKRNTISIVLNRIHKKQTYISIPKQNHCGIHI